MDKVDSIRDLINLWPTRAEMAHDMRSLSSGLTVSTHQVHKWAEKGSIPPRYHWAVLAAARHRGFAVTADLIVELHAPADQEGAA